VDAVPMGQRLAARFDLRRGVPQHCWDPDADTQELAAATAAAVGLPEEVQQGAAAERQYSVTAGSVLSPTLLVPAAMLAGAAFMVLAQLIVRGMVR